MMSLQARIQPPDVPRLQPGTLPAPFYQRTDIFLILSTAEQNSSALVILIITYCFPSGLLWSNTPCHKPLLLHFPVPELNTKSFQDTFLKIKHWKSILYKLMGLFLTHLSLTATHKGERGGASPLTILCHTGEMWGLAVNWPELYSYSKKMVTNTGAQTSGLQTAGLYSTVYAFFRGLPCSPWLCHELDYIRNNKDHTV